MTQDGVVPGQPGPSRRPAGESAQHDAVNLHPADLSVALRSAVSRVGAAGPPPGGLARVRRKARIRQRRRAMMAGTAGVLMIVLGVTVATGGRFSIVPALTGVVGLGNGNTNSQQPDGRSGGNSSAAGDSSQPVWIDPSVSASGARTGPAIGPGTPPTVAPSSAPGVAQVPLCSAATLNISTTLGASAGDIRYGEIDVVPQNTCVVTDPPVLEVTNAAGTAAASVQIMSANLSAAPGLPNVSAAGPTSVLQANQPYEFQFAWVAPACAEPTGSPSATASAPAAPAATAYTLQYAVSGTTTVPGVTLMAACDAQVYVTNVYPHGAYPTPTPAPQPPPPPPSTPTPTGSPSAGPPTVPVEPTATISPAATVAPTESASAPQSDGKATTVPVASSKAG
jgi:hypothetical protein